MNLAEQDKEYLLARRPNATSYEIDAYKEKVGMIADYVSNDKKARELAYNALFGG